MLHLPRLLCSTRTARAAVIHFQRRWQVSEGDNTYDLVVIGGGIVGMATAREMKLRHPNLKMAVLEKENRLAAHQSGHNSGVIHAGIYYVPGSLKAILCVKGARMMYDYCESKNIPYKKCGKLIVATNKVEEERLFTLYQRGLKNKVPDMKLVCPPEMQKIEPYCRGIRAIWSPYTGIVDYALVTRQYGKDFEQAGGVIHLNFKVEKFKESIMPNASDYPITIYGSGICQEVHTKYVLTCGGLYSDVLAELTGCPRTPRIVPFRGEYLLLSNKKRHMVRGNIYPVPDPRFPFLGVHYTPRMDGSIWLGPNAVLAYKREGYRFRDINLAEFFDTFRYRGFWRLVCKYFWYGCKEVTKSIFITLQMPALQKFIPEIKRSDVSRGPAGVRAQALDIRGNFVDDFVFDRGVGSSVIAKNVLHCRNAPSPGATSSLAIAEMVADKLEEMFDIKNTEGQKHSDTEEIYDSEEC